MLLNSLKKELLELLHKSKNNNNNNTIKMMMMMMVVVVAVVVTRLLLSVSKIQVLELVPKCFLGYFQSLLQNLTKVQDWDCLLLQALWKLMEVRYGLRIMLMERELHLVLVFQYQFDEPSMIK